MKLKKGKVIEKIIVFILAFLIDIIFGEYPSIIHPVCYMGFLGKKTYKIIEKINFKKDKIRKTIYFFSGMFSLIIEVSFWIFIIFLLKSLIEKYLELIISIIFNKNVYKIIFCLQILIDSLILKSTFSIRSLYIHVNNCITGDIFKLRNEVSKIVSRNVENLNKNQLYSAALESLSENIPDSILAPIFYFLIFGLYGSIIYRIVNTYDALFGYRNEKYEFFGKFCARTDDILNFIPARLSIIFIIPINPLNSLKYIKKYGNIKINGTYPMSAFAGIQNLSFEKPNCYKFEGKPPEMENIIVGLNHFKIIIFLIFIFTIFSLTIIK
ncbi:MAG: adenosylcobinamide-phosphate synthase CbiB [Spirochaetes bacterium]|nr:adenosylcobinamide-phosphate synthase CbiB [Spirochaetota bacterium]